MRTEAGAQGENRFQVYCAWARTRLQSGGAATVSHLEVDGFRLVSQRRRGRGTAGRTLTTLIRPQVLLSGVLTVEDEGAFARLLATGIGRHRAFGYGMLLLRPPS
jgi:CRISPR system Cascade subunit CasE